MGQFLPSETARLVLSYLLDHKFTLTGTQFMGECPHIQELKSMSANQLTQYAKINGRTLIDILREYCGLISGLATLATEVSQEQFENLQFEPPLRVLKTLGQILKTQPNIASSIEKKTASCQTDSSTPPPDTGQTISTQTDAPASPPIPRKPVSKAVITKSGSCQTNLNLLNFTLPLPKVIQSKEVQTEPPVVKVSSVQTEPLENSPPNGSLSTSYSQPRPSSPTLLEPLTLNFNRTLQNPHQAASSIQATVRSRSISPPKTDVPFFHSNIRVLPRQGYVPILPKPASEPTGPQIPVQSRRQRLADRKNLISATPVSESNFKTRLLVGENSHSTPSQVVKEKEVRKNKPKKNKDSDEEFLNELLGIGDQIANMIPKNLQNQNISDIADKGLDNPKLMENLINVLEGLGDESEDDSRVNTPVTSPLPDIDPRDNVSAEMNETDSLEDTSENLIDTSKGFDADLSVSAVDNTEPAKDVRSFPITNIDTLAMIVNDTIISVTDPYVSPSKPEPPIHTKTKTRKRKASPKHKDNPKKSKEEKSSEVSSSKPSAPPLALTAFARQFKSVLGKGLHCTPQESVPVIADNPLLSRLAKMTRQTFDRNLEIIEVKEEEDAELSKEVSEAMLEESEVKEEEIHITDILPETMEVVVNDQLMQHPNTIEFIVNDQIVDHIFTEQVTGGVASAGTEKKVKKRGPRCKKCTGCTRLDCGECKHCKDKIKFGGNGHLKQACVYRVCVNLGKSPPVAREEILAEISMENVTIETASNDKENDPLKITGLSTDLLQQADHYLHPVHVKKLIFSPPKIKDLQETKATSSKISPDEVTTGNTESFQIKTLSPCKNVSPIKRTNSAWNKDVKNMFSPTNPKSVSTITSSSKDETPSCDPKNMKSTHPATVSVISKQTTPTPILISKRIMFPIKMPMSTVVPISPSSIPPGAIVTPLPPGFKSQGFKAILSDNNSSLEAGIIKKPASSLATPIIAGNMGKAEASKMPDTLLAPPTMPIIEAEDVVTIKDKVLPTPTPEKSKLLASPTAKKSPKSKNKLGKERNVSSSWDSKMRAVLGEAEKDTSHINHRLQDKEKRGRRRSPRKRRQMDKPESDEEYSDQDSLPEIDFGDSNITPEAQHILDTFANRLLEQLEENVAKKVVVPPSPGNIEQKKLFGKSDEKGKKVDSKDCICCKMEKIVDKRKNVGNSEAEQEEVCKKNYIPLNSGERNKDKLGSKEGETSSAPIAKPAEPKAKVSSVPSSDVTIPTFKTPKKSDNFLFKTPVKTSLTTPQKASLLSPQTPRSRHIPASPMNQLTSPRGSRLAIPLTPSRRTPSRTPNRTRHASTLTTPVLNSPNPDLAVAPSLPTMAPTTPNCKNSPCPSYYTPSPSPSSQYSVPSPIQTPGLRFLQEEGERLSQSDDSMSPTKADQSAKRKTFRNLFKKSIPRRKLGSLLEQKIANYPFSTSIQAPLVPPELLPQMEPFMSPSGGRRCLPQMEPFMSPAGQSSCDYTSSPQIVLGRPSPTEDPNHASFVSPNRTCYLSPTGMALSSTVLGFHQSPAHTDSDNTDIEVDDLEIVKAISQPTIRKSKSALNIRLEAGDDTAVDTEESIEAIQAHLAQSCVSTITHCLSDESNTGSLPHTAFAKQKDVALDMLDRVSPEFPELHLSDDSEDEGMEVSEVDSSTERKVKSKETTENKSTSQAVKVNKPSSKTFTPRKPRRVAFTTTSRRSPLKNDSTNFELQHDANNLDKLNEKAGSLLETGGLGTEASIDLGLETAPLVKQSSGKKDSANSSKITPRKRKTVKSPKLKTKSRTSSGFSSVKPSEVASLTPSDSTPPTKRQKVPETAEFDEGKELSLIFSPKKQQGKINLTKVDLTSTDIHPSQLPSVSVNIEKMFLPTKILAPDSPSKSISLPPTPESPARSVTSRSPTPTICKALGLQRSGSKPRAVEGPLVVKDPNLAWAEAMWGLGTKKVGSGNPCVGVGDGPVDKEKRGRRERKESKSEDEEWTPELRSKSKPRTEDSEEIISKKNEKDIDPILLQLRMNKPKSATRTRSKSVERSKQKNNIDRSRSPSGNRKSREPKRSDHPSDRTKPNVPKSYRKDDEKCLITSNKGPIGRHDDLFSPKRTRSRDKIEKEETKDNPRTRDPQRSHLTITTRTSSRDKTKEGNERHRNSSNTKDATTQEAQNSSENSQDKCSPKITRSRSGNLEPKNILEKKKEAIKVSAVSKQYTKTCSEAESKIKTTPKHSDEKVPSAYIPSSSVKNKEGKSVPNILKKTPQKVKTSEPTHTPLRKETKPNIIEELQANELRDAENLVQPKEPSFVVTNKRLSRDQIKNSVLSTKSMRVPKKIEVTLDDDTEIMTSTPINIDLLAEQSAKILSSLPKLAAPSTPLGQDVPQSSDLPVSSSSEPLLEAKSVLSRSSFFVFQNKLPFGVFEEDLQ